MRTEKRRQRGIFGAIVADPYRKMAALVLASGLWFFINAQITNHLPARTISLVAVGSQRVRTEGRHRLAVVLPTDLVVLNRFMDADRPIDSVGVVLSGPRRRLEQFRDATLDLEITRFLALDDWDTRTSVELTAADISLDRTMDDLHIDLIPPRIRVEVSKIDKHPLPLSLDLVDLQTPEQLDSRLRRETASFQPDTAWILGRASAIESFRQRGGGKQLRAAIKSVGSERQVSTSLEIIGGAELGLRFQDQPVLTMEVLPQTAVFELELLIAIDDLALAPEQRGQYQPEKSSRIVRIRAGGELRSRLVLLKEDPDKRALQEWVNDNMRLHVHIPRPQSGASYGPEIDRQARVLLLGTLQASVDRTECMLDESVVVKLLRRGP